MHVTGLNYNLCRSPHITLIYACDWTSTCGAQVCKLRMRTRLIVPLFSYRQDRERNLKLARERLAALKEKRAKKEAVVVSGTDEEQRNAIEKKIQEEEENEKNLLSQEALEIQKGGIVAIQEAVLREIEKKHAVEIKVTFGSF